MKTLPILSKLLNTQNSFSCKVRLTLDTVENKIKLNGVLHNHEPVEGRRKTGELKMERANCGLDPNYFKLRKSKISQEAQSSKN